MNFRASELLVPWDDGEIGGEGWLESTRAAWDPMEMGGREGRRGLTEEGRERV